jgi:hypothetical protein
LKKRRIIYVVDVDFTDQVPEVTIQLWADGIARGIEHNKDEVKHVEYDIQVRDLPEVERQPPDPGPGEFIEGEIVSPEEVRKRLQLPPADET